MKKTNSKQKGIMGLEANKLPLEKTAKVSGGCWFPHIHGARPPKWFPC